MKVFEYFVLRKKTNFVIYVEIIRIIFRRENYQNKRKYRNELFPLILNYAKKRLAEKPRIRPPSLDMSSLPILAKSVIRVRVEIIMRITFFIFDSRKSVNRILK